MIHSLVMGDRWGSFVHILLYEYYLVETICRIYPFSCALRFLAVFVFWHALRVDFVNLLQLQH